MVEASLKQKAIRGGFWVFAARIISRVFSFLRLIILARLLVPEDFGLMGIALLSLATLETFSETGFNQALIQKEKIDRQDLDITWTISVGRGLILFLILFLSAPFLAAFFSAPRAELVIKLIAFGLLFNGLLNSGIVFFHKELDFKKQFFYQTVGDLTEFIIAISFAFWWRNVWALVLGFLSGALMRLVFSYVLHPYRPRLSRHWSRARELLQFGKWVFLTSLVIFLFTQGDDVFVGKFLGVASLGFYQLAYRLSNLPATEISQVISRVTFPAYSYLQKDLKQLRKAYLKTLSLVGFLAFPFSFGLFVLSPEIVGALLGEKWLQIIPILRVLSLFGATRAIIGTGGSVALAVGKPRLPALITSIQLAVMVILIYPLATRFNILGVGLAVLVALLVSLPGQKMIFQQVKLGWKQWLKVLWPSLVASGLMGFCLLLAKSFLVEISFLNLLALVFLGGAIYLGLIFVFVKKEIFSFVNLLKIK